MQHSITRFSARFAPPFNFIASKSIAKCCFSADACAAPNSPTHIKMKRANSSVTVLGVLVT